MHIQKFMDDMGFDEEKLRPYMTEANVNDTALEIIQATTRGDRELYYPSMFGIDSWWIPLIHHVYPSFLEFDLNQFKK